ncbi:SAM-dependent methyltransferase [uncultured Rikenella sp.]|uniref:SAM-dependent methyltransferase n=1 Tax=uncultured Rikenella sp. TaxID=368003 RepID=UPI0025FD2F4C|nr:SAM-dependent methyltransferase [uncultured Rikenella sp.]
MGKLYLIPTPIGENASWDITLPAGNRRLLDEIGYFVVENTRTARRFLARSGLRRPIDELVFTELNEHTPPEAVAPMLEPLLERGENIGVMSEAGLPCIADPGALLVAAAHRHGIEVVPLVGPNSITLALMASGANGQSFAFNGYLPVKAPERQRAIRRFERRAHEERQTQIFIEAPYRNRKLFDDLLAVCSAETHLCVACDLAEPDQYVRSQRIAEWKKSGAPLFEKRPAIFILF